jgi:hypothetical protein
MTVIIDGTTGITTPGETNTGNLSVAGTTTLTGGISGTGVNLASNVTGTLPIANGGTGTTSTTFANLTSNVTGTLPVANGGTGAATLTSNNVLLGNGTSAVQFVAPGSNGNVLTSNGTTWSSSTAPTPTAAQGASWVLLATATAASSSFLTFNDYFTSTYDNYVFVGTGLTSASSATPSGDLYRATFRYAGSYASGTTNTYAQIYNNTSAATPAGQASTTSSDLRISAQSTSCYNLDFVLYVMNPIGSGYKNHLLQSGYRTQSNGALFSFTSALSDNTTTAADGIRFYYSLGNTVSGTIKLYGIKKT